MPKVFSRPAHNYAEGTYGPFSIDGFTKDDTDWLLVTFTVEDWPETPSPIITGQVRWDTGDGADFEVNNPPIDKEGEPTATASTGQIGVPRSGDGKLAVASGTITMQVLSPLRTAVRFEAGRDE